MLYHNRILRLLTAPGGRPGAVVEREKSTGNDFLVSLLIEYASALGQQAPCVERLFDEFSFPFVDPFGSEDVLGISAYKESSYIRIYFPDDTIRQSR